MAFWRKFSPWPLGEDTVSDDKGKEFQLPGEGELPPRASELENARIDSEGVPSRRPGLTELTTATAATACDSKAGLLLLQDSGKIYSVNPTTAAKAEIVTGLAGRAELTEHATQVFYTDGSSQGRIEGGIAKNWGLDVCPTPTLAAVAGSLPAGRYLVVGELKDSSGILHASDLAGVITLSSAGAIQVSFPGGIPSDTTHVRIFLGGPDDDTMYLIGDIPVANFPYTISALPSEDTESWKVGLSPPQVHDFSFPLGDRLMLVAGSWIYPSLGAAVHLYDLQQAVARPETILAGEGFSGGFWTVSASGAYWVSGDKPTDWRQTDIHVPVPFCAGSIQINTSALPGLKEQPGIRVALFWSKWGLAVGKPGGLMSFPMQGRYEEDVSDKRVSFAYDPDGEFRGLLVFVE